MNQKTLPERAEERKKEEKGVGRYSESRLAMLQDINERAKARRAKRKKRISLASKVRRSEIELDRYLMVQYFDRMPIKILRQAHHECIIKYGEQPWKVNEKRNMDSN